MFQRFNWQVAFQANDAIESNVKEAMKKQLENSPKRKGDEKTQMMQMIGLIRLMLIKTWNSIVGFIFNGLQQIHQGWLNVETTLIVHVHQHSFNVDIWLKMKADPTYLYRRCFKVGKTTLKQSRKNSLNQQCFNVEIWLKIKVDPTYVYRRCFNLTKQRWNNVERITSI